MCVMGAYFIAFFPRLQVYPLHSSVTLEEQNNVFLSPVPGYRKVGAGLMLSPRGLCWGNADAPALCAAPAVAGA